MGRYISGGGGSDQPRRKVLTLTSSNPNIPVPEWARGGKGIVRVTGCGGGASGSVGTASNTTTGGGSAAVAREHSILIPAGVSSLSAVIGAGGAPVVANVSTPGNLGGATILTVGSTILRLNGGGNNYRPQEGGAATCGSGDAYNYMPPGPGWGFAGANADTQPSTGLSSPASSLGFGVESGSATQVNGFAVGAMSPWGAPSFFRYNTLTLAAGTGPDGTGYGAGGGGGYTSEGGAMVTSGCGAPGFLTLEFIEGT